MMASRRADVQAYLDGIQASAERSMVDMDPAVARRLMREHQPAIEQPARAMRRSDATISSAQGHAIPVRVYHPHESGEAAPVIVYYHGGGWVLGDVESYDALCAEIAHLSGMTLASVDYRLAPEHLFPAAVEDSMEATAWVAAGPALIGHPVSGLIVAGDSAGGNLAATIARELCDTLPIHAQWLIYPQTDISRVYPSETELAPLFKLSDEAVSRFHHHFLGEEDSAARARHPHASPLLAERWQGLPPALVFGCSLDTLRDQARAYAAKLVGNGVTTIFIEAEGQVHSCFTMRKLLPSAQGDLEMMIEALDCLLRR